MLFPTAVESNPLLQRAWSDGWLPHELRTTATAVDLIGAWGLCSQPGEKDGKPGASGEKAGHKVEDLKMSGFPHGDCDLQTSIFTFQIMDGFALVLGASACATVNGHTRWSMQPDFASNSDVMRKKRGLTKGPLHGLTIGWKTDKPMFSPHQTGKVTLDHLGPKGDLITPQMLMSWSCKSAYSREGPQSRSHVGIQKLLLTRR